MNVIFLDIDGVLNPHAKVKPTGSLIHPEMVARINRVIRGADAEVVITSSWRYMVHGGAMTVQGLGYLLKTHGLCKDILDVTCPDEEVTGRGNQISRWLAEHNVDHYVVIDDLDLDISELHPFVLTEADVGITDADATKALELIQKEPSKPHCERCLRTGITLFPHDGAWLCLDCDAEGAKD